MRTKLFALVCLLVSFGLPMFGQTFGEIGGEIHDVSGAVIAGAEVTILNVATNAVRSATSNEAGVYTFPSLPPGVYNLKATKEGFKTITRNHIEVQVQQNARLDLEMPIGQVSESIEVSSAAVLLTSENAT